MTGPLIQYGYFSFPEEQIHHFRRITDSAIIDRAVQDGGPLFIVDQIFIDGLKELMGNASLNEEFILVEISGNPDTIFTDPKEGSVLGLHPISRNFSHEERLAIAARICRFESTFFKAVMPFNDCQDLFKVRELS